MKRPHAPGRPALSVSCLLAAFAITSLPSATAASTLPAISVSATAPTAATDGSASGLLTFTRTGDTSSGLTVNYALSGSAVKWTDYYRLPQGDMPVAVTIPVGAASVVLAVTL